MILIFCVWLYVGFAFSVLCIKYSLFQKPLGKKKKKKKEKERKKKKKKEKRRKKVGAQFRSVMCESEFQSELKAFWVWFGFGFKTKKHESGFEKK